jgi:hypothetical protein
VTPSGWVNSDGTKADGVADNVFENALAWTRIRREGDAKETFERSQHPQKEQESTVRAFDEMQIDFNVQRNRRNRAKPRPHSKAINERAVSVRLSRKQCEPRETTLERMQIELGRRVVAAARRVENSVTPQKQTRTVGRATP